jgi:hypothetical protein
MFQAANGAYRFQVKLRSKIMTMEKERIVSKVVIALIYLMTERGEQRGRKVILNVCLKRMTHWRFD